MSGCSRLESLVRDRTNARAALTALARFPVRPDDRRLQLRIGFLKADAYVAVGKPDSGRGWCWSGCAALIPICRKRIGERLRMINNQLIIDQ